MKIENRLRKLATENQNYAPLLAQWEFDKRLLARALNTVSNNFPNFSLHDESHSSTIISQIEKVISPNIDFLSATDCWLILESCYWHDSGMIVNYDEKKKLVKDDEFIIHLETLSIGNNEFSEFAKSILEGVSVGNPEKLFDDSQALTYILADYYRAKHASRSEEHVNNPIKIGVDSPRTPLIPRRLISILASVCSSHGKDSSSILELPQKNDGMDSGDYAHPRYVSALLRIGDLLDIDDGRFCPTLLKNIGKIPCNSNNHKKKHDSIKYLYIDSSEIRIRAECNDYDVFDVQQSWFDYIKSEFDYQKRYWNKIVPSPDFSALPTVNDIKCVMLDFITLDGKVPEISLNGERIYNYLTSQLLYGEFLPYIRELVQNSIDAIYFKVWEGMTYHNEFGSESDKGKRTKFFDKINKETVELTLKKMDESNGHILYNLEIRDFGIGMSLEDIRKMTVVGSVNRTLKNRIMGTMPNWALPSGFFGIGMQSVFDSVEKMVIKTRQRGEPCYEVKFIKSTSPIPSIWIRVLEDKWFDGTSVTLELKQEMLPETISLVNDMQEQMYNYDPLVDVYIPVTENYISHAIMKSFKNSSIPIVFNKNKIILGDNVLFANVTGVITNYTYGMDVLIIVDFDTQTGTVYYKDTLVDERMIARGYRFSLNIFDKNAGYWLTVNRDKIRKDKIAEIRNILNEIIRENTKLIYTNANNDNKNRTAFYLKGFHDADNPGWDEYEIGEFTVKDILNNKHTISLISDAGYIVDDKSKNYLVVGGVVSDILSRIIRQSNKRVIIKNIHSISILSHGNIKTDKIIMDMNVVDEYTEMDIFPLENIISSLSLYFKKDGGYMSVGRSCIICYSKKFLDYSLSRNEMPEWIGYNERVSLYFDKFLFLPSKKKGALDKELELIISFYKRIDSSLDEKTLSDAYKNIWVELGIYPPSH